MGSTTGGRFLLCFFILFVTRMETIASFASRRRIPAVAEKSRNNGRAHCHCETKNNNNYNNGRSGSSTAIFMKNNNRLDKGFNLLEVASSVVPQGRIVQTAKESWKFGWKRMMAELAPQDRSGTYRRPSYTFQGKIGSSAFPYENDRYHLYTGNPCPWCHRTRLVVQLLQLEETNSIGVTELVDDPIKASRGGWVFSSSAKRNAASFGCNDLRELYEKLSPGYTGRCTAPLLVDKKRRRIISNESSDIIRMLNDFAVAMMEAKKEKRGEIEDNNNKATTTPSLNLYPPELRKDIDETIGWIYEDVNNGVYRCGFSTTQQSYEKASRDVLRGLDRCERILADSKYLCSNDHITLADVCLLPTVLRFDGVYKPLFKAGGGSVLSIQYNYPHIYHWLRDSCWNTYHPAVSDSIDVSDANLSYYKQLFPLNPGGILPYPPVTAKTLGLEES